jgi:sulfite dehydrogenase (cytochrome) subunit B
MRRTFIYLFGILVFMAAPLAGAQRKTIELPNDNPLATLKPGPGVQVVVNNCTICHSTDYIVRQPKEDLKSWQAEVEKMIKVFGAPASPADAQVIAGYIASHYGVKAQKPEAGSKK